MEENGEKKRKDLERNSYLHNKIREKKFKGIK